MRKTIVARIAFALTAALIIGAAYQGSLDAAGQRYTEAGLQRALLTFAAARGLNAVISVAQSTEVAFEPAGVGVKFGPGEILDPVNDLVERFSWVMLVSGTSLGIQRVLLEISSWRGFTLVLAIALCCALAGLWLRGQRGRVAARWLLKLAMLLTVLRFAVPLIAVANEVMFETFLAPKYDVSRSELEQATERIGKLNEEQAEQASAAEPRSLFEEAKRWYESASQQLDVSARIERYKAAAARTSEHVIELIVVFILQTIVFPLAFLWITTRLIKQLLAATISFESPRQ